MGRLCWTKRKRKNSRNCARSFIDPLAAAAVTAVILWLSFYLGGFAPFGTNTPAVTDAKLQYLDLFAYYRDVLTGRNSVSYTFSNTLGGGAIAIWAYYLASPFNLLVLLFKKEQMNLFLEVLVTVKLSAASASFAWFLGRRFRNRLRREIALVLSVSYGLMQYMLAQGSNVMWLDGVILLPFLVLGVHRTVRPQAGQIAETQEEGHRSRPVLLLVFAAAVSVIVNWYTGGINYLFSLVWFVYEAARGKRKSPGSFRRYLTAMGIGLLLSSVIFVPNVLALRLGKGAAWNPASADFMTAGLRGNPFSALRSYRIGEISDSSRASFFCGSFALFGTAAFFFSDRISKRDKAAGGGLLLFAVMSCFWQPLFVLFSLFQYSNSYWYRYGYLGSFVMLYLAAYWAGSLPEKAVSEQKAAARRRQQATVLKAGASCIFAVLLSQWVWSSGGNKSTRIAVLVLAGITALFLVLGQTGRRAAGIALAVLCTFEMFLQTRAMLNIYHTDMAGEYALYSAQEQEQIEELRFYDPDGFYRISQTSTRTGNMDGLTAAYLDAMAYGYASVSGYTSCPENVQLDFLDRLGYRKEYESFNIVNTSFLPADSLLSVRYVLSAYEIPGLKEVGALGKHNGKAVYENPYALPMAILTRESAAADPETAGDPFAYLEQIYSALSGEEAGLFVPVSVKKETGRGETAWTLTVPEGNYCLYGNLPWKESMEGRLMVSEDWGYGYGGWLSPSVFYIPVPERADSVRVTFETDGEPEFKAEQFFALDLNRFEEVTEKIRARSEAVRDLEIANGRIACSVNAEEGQELILSVPASEGWTVRVNGQKAESEVFSGCLIKLALVQGENHITMQYRVPGMAAGLGLTLAGVCILTVFIWRKERKKK